MMEERDLLCKRLAAKNLGRRVFFHYALNVRLAQKQREAVAQIKRRVASRVKREVLIWWRAVRERELLGNMFAMTRQERLKMNTVTHWKNWASGRIGPLEELGRKTQEQETCNVRYLRQGRCHLQAEDASQLAGKDMRNGEDSKRYGIHLSAVLGKKEGLLRF